MNDDPTRRLGDAQRLGDQIGPYELVEVLGEGGMGRVFLARQREPIQRDVAIKLIKLGMDTEKVVGRFELERQTLALMDHPNIARVLDAGATPDGRPYFVMEYVPGIPLTEYCDQHRLSTSDRLELFVDICEAVQHAHQRGIIHRDLKPSNVLVERVNDRPTAKIIDFGVAKATARQLVQETMFTEQGQLVGTPEYMSPEQAELGDAQIDTRTDIYSLGVLLYELLVGVLPFDSASLRAAGLGEIYRILREEEPPRPSTRLSTLGAESGQTAERRQTSARILLSELRGDLDQIVMKAIDKDRARRYASASEFAADVRRFLQQEPVLASAPTFRYRARKFVRRNRALVIAVAAIAIALLLGVVGSTWQAIRASRAESEALLQAELANRTREYLLTVFEQADPSINPMGRETSIQDALDRATLELGSRFEDEPEVEAAIHQTLGEAYDAMGEFEVAAEHARRALERLRQARLEWSVAGFQARLSLATALGHQGRVADAEDLVLAGMKRPEFAELPPAWRGGYLQRHARSQQDLGAYAEADSLYLASINTFESGDSSRGQVHSTLRMRAGLLRKMGRRTEAESINRQLLAELPDTDERIYRRSLLLTELAILQESSGRVDEALETARGALADQQRVLGPKHLIVAQTHALISKFLNDGSRFEEALTEIDIALAIFAAVVGPDHHSTLNARNTRANILKGQGKLDESLAAHEQLLADQIRVRGEGHPDVILAQTNLYVLLTARGRTAEARALIDEAIAQGIQALGPAHPLVLTARNHRANWLEGQGQFEAARAEYESIIADAEKDRDVGRHHPEVIPSIAELGKLLGELGEIEAAIGYITEANGVLASRYPDGHSYLQTGYNNLGVVLQESGDLEGASEAYARSIEIGVRIKGAGHPDLIPTRNNRASIERSLGNYEEAERLFAQVVEDFTAHLGPNHVNTLASRHNHGYTLIFLNRLEDAEDELVAALSGLRSVLPAGHLYISIFQSSLGLCHARQGKYEEAERELTESWNAVVAQLGEEHQRSQKIAGYLAENYELWGRPDMARNWRARAGDSSG